MSAITSESLLKSIAAMEKQLAAMRSALESVAPEAVVVAKKSKKSKKSAESTGEEPKEKKEPNGWVKFTSRISALLKANAKSVPVAQQKTFASHLKGLAGETYPEMTDERILEELAGWTCPEPKPRTKKVAEASDAGSESGSVTSEKKKRAPMSEETKAAAAAKRAATKAAKKAASAEPQAAAVIVASTPVETAAAPAAKKIPKKVVAKPEPKPVSLKFESWVYEGEDCWQNERGDCLNPEGEWLGRFEGGKLNSKVTQPGDLEAAIQELME